MKRWLTVCILLISCLTFAQHGKNYTRFVENKGQWGSQIRYKAEMTYGSLFCENDRLTFALEDPSASALLHQHAGGNKEKCGADKENVKMHAWQMKFKNSNTPLFQTTGESKHFYNYYIGNDSKKWASHVKEFSKVMYKDIFDGIDFIVYPQGNGVKYDYVIHAGADAGKLAVEYEGVDFVKLRNKKLEIRTSVNTITEVIPKAYQIIKNDTLAVNCEFVLDNNTVSFRFPDGYNKASDVVIDPVLVFASYSGSTADNFGFTATFDEEGFLYAGGIAYSIGYPTTIGAYNVSFSGGIVDVVISKYDTTGNFMVYSTYLGGNAIELPHSLIVNRTNELLVMGTTGSSNFPTSIDAYSKVFHGGTPYQINNDNLPFFSGSDIFISKLSSSGGNLLASTYFGGTGNDGLNSIPALRVNYADEVRGEINIDDNNNVYIGSVTQSSDLPTSANAFQSVIGGGQEDGCIVKFDANLSNIIWCSYFGGNNLDAIYSLKVNSAKNEICVVGGTSSTNFPISSNALQKNNAGGRADGFIATIRDNGTGVVNSTYYGSSSYDQIYMADLDKQSNIYVFGQTQATGSTFIKNAMWNSPGGGQLLSKITPNLDTVVWSTVFGTATGVPNISPAAFMVDLCNKIYLTGWGGWVNDLPGCIGGNTYGLPVTADAFQKTTDGSDFYLMVMNDDASNIVYGSFIGGTESPEHVDGGTSRFDKKGRVYQSVCAGCWNNSDFPTTTVMDTNKSIGCNNAVFKFDFKLPLVVANFDVPKTGCAPYTVTFNNTSAGASTYFWDFGDGYTSTAKNPSHAYANAGNYTIRLVASNLSSCNFSDTISKKLLILSNNPAELQPESICMGASVQLGYAPSVDPTIHYSWTPTAGLSNPNVSNPIASPTVTTTYTVNVSNGVCSANIEQVVTLYSLTIAKTSKDALCYGSADGWAKVMPSGGLPNYTYRWNTGATTDSIAHLISGTYSVVITDSKNCRDIYSLIITQPDSIKILVTDTVLLVCNGNCYGHINLQIQSGIAPYTYNWNSGQQTKDISGICAGDYRITVSDAHNCKNDLLIPIRDTSKFNVVLSSKTDVSCFAQCDGAAHVEAQMGTLPYDYHWSNGNSTNQISNVCVGNYGVTVSDANNCKMNIFVPINEPSKLQLNVNKVKDPTCFGYNNGIAMLSSSGGTPAYHYNWNNQNSDSVQMSLTIGVYQVTVTDAHQCKDVKTVILNQPTQIQLNVLSSPTTCTTSCDGSAIVFASGSVPKYSYQWSNGSTDSSTHKLCVGLNSVTVTDARSCRASSMVNVSAGTYILPVSATIEKDSVYVFEEIKLHAFPDKYCTYQWTPSELFDNSNLANAIAHSVENMEFTVTVTDTLGCSNKANVHVNIKEMPCASPYIYVPNAFTPDGDNENDVLYVRGKIISDLYFTVYDRWGEKVFETKDINHGWDGIYKGKAADPGVFVYYLEATCITKEKFFKKGNITLIR